MLEKMVRINNLYDFYQPLLTEKQRQYMDLYYVRDFSLGEIAENFGISRQAIYDNLKRTVAILETFEGKLGLHEKYTQRAGLLQKMRTMIEEKRFSEEKVLELIALLENLD